MVVRRPVSARRAVVEAWADETVRRRARRPDREVRPRRPPHGYGPEHPEDVRDRDRAHVTARPP
ncbi:hypothetical protein ACWECC_28450 [Streptomyces microflavus]|uniref:hypothetical protein n=1 Tax=Streptomyces microflavus TaxID=1919 RepID=UPI0033B04559